MIQGSFEVNFSKDLGLCFKALLESCCQIDYVLCPRRLTAVEYVNLHFAPWLPRGFDLGWGLAGASVKD